MIRRVYIETTIPSFYHEVRTEPKWSQAERGRASGGTVTEPTSRS